MACSFIVLLIATNTVQAQFQYTNINGSLTIIKYTGTTGEADIPATINVNGNDLPVTGIGDAAFANCYSLTDVVIPSGVTNIGVSAFGYCGNLTNIFIPDGVLNIGVNAFVDCSSLQYVKIPDSVTSLGNSAFFGSGLTNIIIGTNITSIGYETFFSCSKLTRVTIPTSVTFIDQWAFAGCGLTSLTIPSGVTTIIGGAFGGCNFTNVSIPNNVTNIGAAIFNSCANLKAITVDPSHPTLSSIDGVLFDKAQVTLIEYPAGARNAYTIPNGVTSLAAAAFARCTNLASVTIPNSVTNIGNAKYGGGGTDYDDGGGVFLGCTSLTNITIPDSVINIGQYAFFISGLTEITIGNHVTSIGRDSFDGCGNLTSVFFRGNSPSPSNDTSVFSGDTLAIAYYQTNTTGWGPMFDGIPTGLWVSQPTNLPPIGLVAIGNYPVVVYPPGTNILVQMTTNLASGPWVTVTNGVFYNAIQVTNAPRNVFFRTLQN